MSPERIDILQIGGVFYQLQPLPRWMKKIGEFWSTNKNVLVAHIDPPKRTLFGRLHFGPWGVLPPQIFTRVLPSLASAHYKTWTGVPPKKNFNGKNLKLGLKFSV